MSAWTAYHKADGTLHSFGDESNRPLDFPDGVLVKNIPDLPAGGQQWSRSALAWVAPLPSDAASLVQPPDLTREEFEIHAASIESSLTAIKTKLGLP